MRDPAFFSATGELIDDLDGYDRWHGIGGVLGRGRGELGQEIDVLQANATVPADYDMVISEVTKMPVEDPAVVSLGVVGIEWINGLGGVELVNAKIAWRMEECLFGTLAGGEDLA